MASSTSEQVPALRKTDIPLVADSDVDRTASIGTLVKDATKQMSTLVRAEIELAKTEISQSVKQGVTGGVFFIVAATVGLFSLFFFFFMLGEILDIWLPRWLAFTIVFVLMLLVAGLFAFLGLRKVRKVRKPEQTINSLEATKQSLVEAVKPHQAPGAALTTSPAPRPASER